MRACVHKCVSVCVCRYVCMCVLMISYEEEVFPPQRPSDPHGLWYGVKILGFGFGVYSLGYRGKGLHAFTLTLSRMTYFYVCHDSFLTLSRAS